jgi:hypothetical protein
MPLLVRHFVDPNRARSQRSCGSRFFLAAHDGSCRFVYGAESATFATTYEAELLVTNARGVGFSLHIPVPHDDVRLLPTPGRSPRPVYARRPSRWRHALISRFKWSPHGVASAQQPGCVLTGRQPGEPSDRLVTGARQVAPRRAAEICPPPRVRHDSIRYLRRIVRQAMPDMTCHVEHPMRL